MAGAERRSGRRPTRDERRVQLLDAAVEAIQEHGSGASMEQLATAAGVTKPILYRHFGDRDGLAQALGDRFMTGLLDRLSATLHSPAPEDVLFGTIDAYLAFLESEPDLYGFLTSPTAGRASLEQATAVLDTVARQVAIAIGDQLRTQGLDAGAAEPYAFGIVGMVHQAGDWWLRSQSMSREALTTYLANLLWSGFEGIGNGAPSRAPGADQT